VREPSVLLPQRLTVRSTGHRQVARHA